MSGGQAITSGIGSVVQDATVAIVGTAIASATGYVSGTQLLGAQAASGIGTAVSGIVLPLRSRKVVGGTATKALSGSAFTVAQGTIIGGPGQLLSTSLLSGLQGSCGKSAAVALTGKAMSASQGALTGTGDPTWFQNIPAISFTSGTASSINLIQQYSQNYNAALHDVQLQAGSPALPSGVTLSSDGLLSYNGSGPVASAVSGYVFEIINQASPDDWATRSVAAGVIKANRLNNATNLTAVGTVNASQWGLADGNQFHITLDTTIKPVGSTGSFKFDIFNTDSASSGNLGFYFGEVRSFTQGDTIWFSYRRRAGADMVYQPYYQTVSDGGGATNHKLSILAYSGATSISNEIVVSDTSRAGVVGGYHQNGNGFPGEEAGAVTPCSNSDIRVQPSVDIGSNPLTGTNPDSGVAWTACNQARAQYGALYSAYGSPGAENVRNGFGDPFSIGAVRHEPDEWMTYTCRVVIGTWGTASSRYTMWVARDGAAYRKIFDSVNITLGTNHDYDTLWLLPYRTRDAGGGRNISSRTTNIGGTTVLACSRGLPLGNGILRYNASTQRFQWAAAGDSFGTARGFSSANGILTLNISSASDRVATTLASPVSLPQSSIDLVSAASFPISGTVMVSSVQVQYTGKSGNTLTGCTYTATNASQTYVMGIGTAVTHDDYIVVRVNPSLLPTSGIIDDSLTVAEGRPDSAVWYADAIISTQAINAPGGFAPVG